MFFKEYRCVFALLFAATLPYYAAVRVLDANQQNDASAFEMLILYQCDDAYNFLNIHFCPV